MGSIGVLLVVQVIPYLEQELNKRYRLFRVWDYPQKAQLLSQHAASIRAVVGNAYINAVYLTMSMTFRVVVKNQIQNWTLRICQPFGITCIT
ncbi:Glyoxylate/hydroxypyruvate reductase A HPR2 [Spatholobus suberectus]|nr:Glyoxylate/hydroxypyruvate reductase A HPR2 [Spatholobus suberectus]